METETWDVFISHASEDKEEIARPLYDMLDDFGLTVWYDESEIECSDDILDKISYGLENTNYFIILLSPDFIREDKVWTYAENESIGYIRTVNKKRVIPIYHNLIVDDLNHKFLYLKSIASFYTDKETMLDYSSKIVKKILEFNLQNILEKEIDIDELIEISLKYISSLNTTRDKIKKAEDTKEVLKFLYKLDCDFIPILEEIVDRKEVDHSNIGNYIKLLTLYPKEEQKKISLNGSKVYNNKKILKNKTGNSHLKDYQETVIKINEDSKIVLKTVPVEIEGKVLHVSIYPVTFEEYDLYCQNIGKTYSFLKGYESKPVVKVNWNNANEYCRWLSLKINKECKLIDSKDWEFISSNKDIKIENNISEWCNDGDKNSKKLKNNSNIILVDSNLKNLKIGFRYNIILNKNGETMCGIEARKNANSAILILEQALKYLTEYKKQIIQNIVESMENNSDNVYIYELKDNKENFLLSLDGHFEWMKDYIKKPNKTKTKVDDIKYNSLYIVDSLQLAYCDFYQKFEQHIETIDKHEKVKNILKKLSKALFKKYKC